jgi:hypothetical protein
MNLNDIFAFPAYRYLPPITTSEIGDTRVDNEDITRFADFLEIWTKMKLQGILMA